MTTDAQGTQTVELSLEEMFDQAEAEELALAADSDVDPDSPAGETEAEALDEDVLDGEEVAEPEQAEAEDTFDFELEDEDEDDTVAPDELDLSKTVPVKGHGEVSIEELRNGYMMQADYTRSKQALKEEKEAFAAQQEAAATIMENLRDDPVGVAAYLALETGLIKESDLSETKVAALRDAVKVPKADEMQAEIDRKVEEALASHPEVQEARTAKVRAAIDAEFSDIEKDLGQPLSEKAKVRIIKYANEHDLVDLRVAFDALSSVAARKRAARDKLKQTATERPGRRKPPRDLEDEPVESLDDALAIALAIHGED